MESRGSITRRTLIGGAAAGGAALALPHIATSTASGKGKRPYALSNRIDVHAHYISPGYRSALAAQGIFAIGGIPIPEWTPDSALGFMDRWGIQAQMLSVSDPGVAFMPDEDAAELARDCNEYVAGLMEDHPGRFGGFAVVPLHDVSQANAEVDYAMDTLGLDGVGLLSSHDGLYLGDPVFDTLMSNLNDRGSWVFVHPTAVSADDRPSYQIPNFIAEYPFDTTRSFISLLFNGVFHNYPNIRWHFAHGGGTLPMLRFRLTSLAAAAAEVGPLIGLPSGSSVLDEKSAIAALQASFLDTALIAEKPALEAVHGVTKLDGMVFGSDYPFAARLYLMDGSDPQPGLSRVFENKERKQIDRLNALQAFPRLAEVEG